MKLSVIVPAHVLDANLAACLQALERAAERSRFEVVLVLDGVAPSRAFLDRFELPELQVVPLAQNHGPAYARNAGAQQAYGTLLFFVDADVEVHPDTVEKVLAHFAQPGAADALIGSYDDQPTHPGTVARFRNLLHHYTHQQAAEEAQTFWGACGAVRREAFEAVGGFSTVYRHPSIEDIELGYRLVAAGYRIRLQKDWWVTHRKAWTLANMVRTDIFRRARPWTLLLLSRGQALPQDLNTQALARWSTAAVAVVLVCFLIGFWNPWGWMGLGVGIGYIMWLNRRFYVFLRQHFSAYRMPGVVALHGLYYLSAGIGWGLGWLAYLTGRRAPSGKE